MAEENCKEAESGTAAGTETGARKFNWKGFTAFAVAATFLVLGFSGIILYFTPRGRVAHWTNWSMLGLTKDQWAGVHINAAWLFLVGASFHLYFNWTVFCNYIKRRTRAGLNLKRELGLAVAVAAVFVAGTLFSIPPFSSVLQANDAVKAYWARTRPVAPFPHAESMTLENFARAVGLTQDQVAHALKTEGFPVVDAGMTVAEIARRKGVPPSDVFKAIKKHHPEAQGFARGGRGWGRGQGRGRGGRGWGLGQGRGRGGRGWGRGQGRGRDGRGWGRGQGRGRDGRGWGRGQGRGQGGGDPGKGQDGGDP